MKLENRRLFFISLFLIFFSALLLKLPGAIFPPTDYYYDPVERAEIFSIFGLFAGLIPAAVTFWSLGIYAIPLILLYTLDFALIYPQALLSVLKHNPGPLINGLSIYIANAFLGPSRQLVIGRLFVAIITSFAPLALYRFFYKKNYIAAAIFSVILFSTSPFLLKQNYSFLPDPIGLMFFVISLIIILGSEKLGAKKIFIGSIFLGLAIAAKFIYVAFLPTAFLAILLFSEANRRNSIAKPFTKNALIFIAALFLIIFIFVPFIWTAPLALTKNLFGTLRQYYGSQANWGFLLLKIIPSFIDWLGLPFFLIGFIFSFFIFNKKTAILLAISFFSFLIPLGNARFILQRYALALIPFLCIYAGIGLEVILARIRRYNYKILLIVLVSVVIFISNLRYVVKDYKITHNKTNAMDCVNWIKANVASGSNIGVPEDNFAYFFVPSEYTLQHWLNKLDNSYNNIIEARLNNLFSMARTKCHNLNSDNPLVSKIFGPLEQQGIFVYKMLLWYFRNVEKPALAYNLFLYLPPERDKLGIISARQEEILNLFLERKLILFVSDKDLAMTGAFKVKCFNHYPVGKTYYLYLNNNLK